MKKKELLKRIEELEVKNTVNKERIFSLEDVVFELKHENKKIAAILDHLIRNEIEEKVELLKDTLKAMAEKFKVKKEDNCKKCDEKPLKKCKKCEKTKKAAPKTEEIAEIKVGDMVRVISSESDHIKEIKDMIGKICKVKNDWEGEIFDVWQPDKRDYWSFSRDEIEPVAKKKGRGRPLGSKNKNKKESK